MLSAGDISQARYRAALASPLGLHPARTQGSAAGTYLADFITSQLVSQYGANRVREGGLKVYTTLDSKKQAEATQSILGTLDSKGDPAGSIVSIDPIPGTSARWQPRRPASRCHSTSPPTLNGRRARRSRFHSRRSGDPRDQPVRDAVPFGAVHRADNWHVATYEHTYSGRIPISQATLLSDNAVYARLTLDLGPKPIAVLAKSMGVQSPLKAVPSIALGVNAISPLTSQADTQRSPRAGSSSSRRSSPRWSSPTATPRRRRSRAATECSTRRSRPS